ncbi:MAG: hypothetical protein JJT88_09310 [Gammaproteobacteria bacterium]|nr:hypothetical protein [Gammaproteobacteria bacterium]
MAWPKLIAGSEVGQGVGADWQQVPEDAAVVILFRETDRHRGRLDFWYWGLSGQGIAWTGGHMETLIPMPNMAEAPAPLTAARATRLILWPGRYRTSMTRQLQTHEEKLTLNAGDLLILQLDADRRTPFARAVSPEAFATHLSRRGGIGWRSVDRRAYQTSYLMEQHFDALEITPDIDGFCRDGVRTLRWHNAQFEAELVDCGWRDGQLRFDDGTTVALSLPDLSARSIVVAHPLDDGNTQFHTFHAGSAAGTPGAVVGGLGAQDHGPGQPWPEPPPPAWRQWFPSESGLLRAIDGQPVAGLDETQLDPLLRGAPGSRVRITVQSHLPDAGGRSFEFELARNLRAVDVWPYRLLLPQQTKGRITRPNGSRYAGGVQLLRAKDGHLPVPRPDGSGRKMLADGSGYEGRFRNGGAEGLLWCIELDDEGPCEFAGGWRLSETGAVLRTPEEILASQPGFGRDMTIDLLRRQHIEALLDERWTDFLQLDADLTVLGADTGVEALFYVARALAATGRPEIALQRAMAYLNLAGAEGAAYGEALSLVSQLRPQAEQARTTREAALAELHQLRGTLPK